MPEEEAVQDFLLRIRHYVDVYEPLDDSEGSAYVQVGHACRGTCTVLLKPNSLVLFPCQLIDVGKKIIAHRVHGFLPTQIMTFVTNLHVAPRPIWLTRHGESIYNTKVRAGRAVAPVTGL